MQNYTNGIALTIHFSFKNMPSPNVRHNLLHDISQESVIQAEKMLK